MIKELGAMVLAGYMALGIGGCVVQESKKDKVPTTIDVEVICGHYQKDMTTYGFFDDKSNIGCAAMKGSDKDLFDSLEKVKFTLGELIPGVCITAKVGNIDGSETKEKIDCYQLLNYEK